MRSGAQIGVPGDDGFHRYFYILTFTIGYAPACGVAKVSRHNRRPVFAIEHAAASAEFLGGGRSAFSLRRAFARVCVGAV
jgi:hypothetical protein